MIPITDETGWKAVAALPAVLLLKHGAHCPISAHARSELLSYEAKHGGCPVYSLDVTAHRALSLTIAQSVDVEHESPQVLLLRGGTVAWHTGHYSITADDIAARLRTSPDN